MKYIRLFERVYEVGNLYKLYLEDVHDGKKNIMVNLVFVVKLEQFTFGGNYGRISGVCVSPDEYKGLKIKPRGEELTNLLEPSKEEIEEYNFLINVNNYNL